MVKLKSLNKMQEFVINFHRERGWYGAVPQDYAKSLVMEAGELLEHFQWDGGKPKEEQFELAKEKSFDIGEELSDILWYLLATAEASGVDIVEAFNSKLIKNVEKYPAKKIGRKEYWEIKKKHRADRSRTE